MFAVTARKIRSFVVDRIVAQPRHNRPIPVQFNPIVYKNSILRGVADEIERGFVYHAIGPETRARVVQCNTRGAAVGRVSGPGKINLIDLYTDTEFIFDALALALTLALTLGMPLYFAAISPLLLIVEDFEVRRKIDKAGVRVIVVRFYIAPLAIGRHVKRVIAKTDIVGNLPVEVYPGPEIFIIDQAVFGIVIVAPY